jgi:ATP-dependent RNA helicase RhlE
MNNFSELHLHPKLNQALELKGYTLPTPIQSQAIPYLMAGRDLLGIAQTGTGKTAAFSLPLLHHMLEKPVKVKPARVRALILTPTRELASQIKESLDDYSAKAQIKTAVVFGGVGHRPQIMSLSKGLDFLVATPGRLLDLMSDGHVLFDQLEYFVLDEADRMLDMGFIRDIKKIIEKIPKQRQTLLFSATMPKDIIALSAQLLQNPAKVEVTPESTTVEKIEQSIYMIEKAAKVSFLIHLLKDQDMKTVLVFSRTKHGANKIVKKLDEARISCAAIHGNKSQGAREKALQQFKSSQIRVLIATDIAARGLDIPLVGHIINFDLPDDPKNYVHRIGRTARAGREGIAISLCDRSELGLLKDIEKQIQLRLKIEKTPEFTMQAPPARSSVARVKQPVKKNTQRRQEKRNRA